MKYSILANPISGKLPLDAKASALARAATILRADLHGLDTGNREEFQACAREVAQRCDVLAVAGGDGTLSDVINAVDTKSVTLAYLPFGSGNALGYALDLLGPVERAAQRILDGEERPVDLVECDGRLRGYLVSVGFDGDVIRRRDSEPTRYRGLSGYARASIEALALGPRTRGATLSVDGESPMQGSLFSLAVVKEPFYGYGLRWVPGAVLDDGLLHLNWTKTSFAGPLGAVISGFVVGNKVGLHRTARELEVSLDEPAWLQVDGNLAWKASRFQFRVRPAAWTLRA